ncbi:MAG: VIT1/CCC1 transporter family protein, partial [Acidobacteriota bacterium]|nr:VIT1/CCC1 transporter family protein [Acidobacteriota bacterium]
ADHYGAERLREEREVKESPEEEKQEVAKVFSDFGLSPEHTAVITEALSRHPKAWIDFMMRFELGLEAPDPRRALRSAATIAASYVVGGLIPLCPYMLIHDVRRALLLSVGLTLVALFVFGFIKGKFTGISPLRGGIQTVLIGGMAASAAFGIALLLR